MTSSLNPEALNPETQWRLGLAHGRSQIWPGVTGLAAAMVGGSVARGLADAASDLEIGVFWQQPPTDEDRTQLLQALGVQKPRSFPYFPEEDLWLDQGQLGGVRLDLIHRTVEGVEAGISAVLAAQTVDLHALNALSALQSGVPLFGEHLLNTWRIQAQHYPRPLALAVMDVHLEPTPTSWLQQHAVRREYVPLYGQLIRDQKNILMVLMAMNSVYPPHAEFKWLGALEALLPLRPRLLVQRLEEVLSASPAQGIETLHALWEETYALAGQHFPEAEQVRKAQRWLNKAAETFKPLE
ncbi:nucleotidyltransferase domain-containing protein [Deinococcus hopiensis]|uniref:DUF4037 domain-containing protein n=1 Tax=Deinococcus hopiensis KR-140 TaxID=695939 RepID=A0A1W1UL65_9DEIO|nr:nucleotidyltransferase domain-containing protein [Deinococcus hopiensis]SMB81812.1 hypothetical protein SAMN00790413_04731 [Deinococcus hopiensis KR-140]